MTKEIKKGESWRRGYMQGQNEATPQYKKDMQDAYEKGRKEEKERIKEIIKKLNVDELFAEQVKEILLQTIDKEII